MNLSQLICCHLVVILGIDGSKANAIINVLLLFGFLNAILDLIKQDSASQFTQIGFYVLKDWWEDMTWCQCDKSWFLTPVFPPVCHTITWPLQTLTASHSRACLMERNSWTDSSRQSSLETLACHSGGQVRFRPGWRSSWGCPCTSEPARRTSKVARYASGYVALPPFKWKCLDSGVSLAGLGSCRFRCCWSWQMTI